MTKPQCNGVSCFKGCCRACQGRPVRLDFHLQKVTDNLCEITLELMNQTTNFFWLQSILS